MLVFVGIIVVTNAVDIVCMIYFECMQYNSMVLRNVTLLVLLAVSYYTTALIFLLGLNHLGAFCSPKLNRTIMKR